MHEGLHSAQFRYHRGKGTKEAMMPDQSRITCTYLVGIRFSEQSEGGPTRDGPTAGEALKRLEPLVGEWILEAKPPEGPPWPG
jgi:hypothetical protein